MGFLPIRFILIHATLLMVVVIVLLISHHTFYAYGMNELIMKESFSFACKQIFLCNLIKYVNAI